MNKNFLLSTKKIVDIYRLNLSHLSINDLKKNLIFLKKNNIKNICLDTEGAQIRTFESKKKIFKKGSEIKVYNKRYKLNSDNIILYPEFNIKSIKKKTKIHIGFDNLLLEVKKNYQKFLLCKVISEGILEKNKGVHFEQKIDLNFLTNKDLQGIEIAKKYNIKYYALSFTNFSEDVKKFRNVIGKDKFLISKIETKNAVRNFKKITSLSNATLIDRGDLSREIDIIEIPKIQEKILDLSKKIKAQTYVATNLLETMILNPKPTRAESNDIYHTLKSGASGLVLAAETAIGKYPIMCVNFINNFIKKNLSKK